MSVFSKLWSLCGPRGKLEKGPLSAHTPCFTTALSLGSTEAEAPYSTLRGCKGLCNTESSRGAICSSGELVTQMGNPDINCLTQSQRRLENSDLTAHGLHKLHGFTPHRTKALVSSPYTNPPAPEGCHITLSIHVTFFLRSGMHTSAWRSRHNTQNNS